MLGFKPFRLANISGKPKFDKTEDIDDVKMLGGWFKMDQASKLMESWQSVNPVTAEFKSERDATTMGYSVPFARWMTHLEVNLLLNKSSALPLDGHRNRRGDL